MPRLQPLLVIVLVTSIVAGTIIPVAAITVPTSIDERATRSPESPPHTESVVRYRLPSQSASTARSMQQAITQAQAALTTQNGSVILNRTFGGNDNDSAFSVVQTSDGGLAFAGWTESFGSGDFDAWVVKLAPNGTIVLNRTLGGPDRDLAFSLVETSDGGLAFAGGFDGNYSADEGDAWVVKLASNGSVVLNRTLGGRDSDAALSLVETRDGHLAFAGSFAGDFSANEGDAWVVKLAPNGTVVMNHTLSGPGRDFASLLIETNDGGLAFAGSFGRDHSEGEGDAWVVKLASNGTIVLNRTLGGDGFEEGTWLVEMSDGGLAMAGNTESFGNGKINAWVVKLAHNGTIVMNRTLGESRLDYAWSLIETSDQGLMFAGETKSFGNGSSDAWLVKLGNVPITTSVSLQDGTVTPAVAKESTIVTHNVGFTVKNLSKDGSTDRFYVTFPDVVAGNDLSASFANVTNRTDGTDVSITSSINQVDGPDNDSAVDTFRFAVSPTGSGTIDVIVNLSVDVLWPAVITDATYDIQAAVNDSAAGETSLRSIASVSVLDVTAQGEGPSVVFNRTYGMDRRDRAFSVVDTSDGGLAFTGLTSSFGSGNFDAWVVKLAPNGSVVLNRTFGGGKNDVASSIVETSDGGLAFAGRTNSFGSSNGSAWVVKLAPNGSVVLNRTVGGAGIDTADSLIETSDGGLVFTGTTTSFGSGNFDAWVVKLAPNGPIVMNHTVGGSEYDSANSLVRTSDSGLAFAGRTESFGSSNGSAWVVKLAPNGSVVLNRTVGGTGSDAADSLVETSEGGLVFAGRTDSFGSGNFDAWMVKLASDGDIVLNRTFGGDQRDHAFSVVEMSDGGLAFAGETTSFGSGTSDGWVVKLAPNGTVLLNRTFGGSGLDTAVSLVETSSGRLAVGGETDSFGSQNGSGWILVMTVPSVETTSQVTRGDVNQDGTINTGDVIQVQRSIVGLSTVSEFSTQAADVTADGNVNTGDVIQIQRFIVGLSSVLD